MRQLALPAFTPRSDWRPPKVSDLPSWKEAGRVAVDVETNDPDLKTLGPGVRRGAYIVGVSFAIEDGPAHYLPVAHEGGDNLDRDLVFRYLRDQAAAFKGDLGGANLQYDLDFLAQAGVEDLITRPRFHRDVQVAQPLIDELADSFSLDNIAKTWSLPGKNEKLLREAADAYGIDAKAMLWRLPARFVGAYAEDDARLPLTILRRQERVLEEQGLWKVYDLESRLLPVLLKMRRRGVRIDMKRLDEVEAWALKQEMDALEKVRHLTGRTLTVEDTTKAVVLGPVLEKVGIKVPRTAGRNGKPGLPSVKNDLLKAAKHPVADAILRAKKFNKLRTSFVASRREHAVNGRIHATFNQLRGERRGAATDDDLAGAAFGRLSSCDPNIQQEPARDKEIGPVWRSIYLPEEGCEWACEDFSQQEPRWTIHFAEVSGCKGAKELGDRYRKNPSIDSHQMIADMAGIERDPAKIIFLALIYGMGGAKLCRSLGLPTKFIPHRRTGQMMEVAGDEGQVFIDEFNRKMPFLRELADRAMRRAANRGYVVTAGGRRCRFPLLPDGRYDWTYKALNRVIQGTSGDQMKTALVEADAAGFPLALQVHDEADLSITSRKQALDLADLMRNCMPCVVPAKVDVEVGPNWGTLTKVATCCCPDRRAA